MADPKEEAGGLKYTEPPKNAPDLSDEFEVTEKRSRRRQLAVALLVLCVSLTALALRIRGHRHLTYLRTELRAATARPAAPATEPGPFRPGGQDPILMTRSALPGSEIPEFISATLLPGRGMNVFQITADVPGVGPTPLLAVPSLDSAASALTGSNSGDFGAPFILPWSGRIPGPTDAKAVTTQWDGRILSLPPSHTDRGSFAVDGLFLGQASDSTHHDIMPDGSLDQATFPPGDFGGHWPSRTQVTVAVLLSGRILDLTVTARNAGSIPEPMGIGWQPRFLLSGDRSRVRLHLPGSLRVEERATGQPTGKLLPVEGTVYDFTARGGVPLGDHGIDASFVHLHSAPLDSGPIVEFLQPDRGYGVRIIALTDNIRSLRVVAPAGANYISLQPNFNYDDPFGHQWPRDENTGIVILQPGQTTQWRIRLELFSPSTQPASSVSPEGRFDPLR